MNITINTKKHHICLTTSLLAVALKTCISTRIATEIMGMIDRTKQIQTKEVSELVIRWLASSQSTSAQQAQAIENALNSSRLHFAAKTGKIISSKAQKFNWVASVEVN